LEVVDLLAEWEVTEEFYLAGGTALALHLGHRQSNDLDFFTRDPRNRLPARLDVDAVMARFRSVEWELSTPAEMRCRIDGVEVTFLAYPFSHRFALWSWRGLSVADPRDIATQKAYTLGRRAQARDYLDLGALLAQNVVGMDDLLDWARDTYGEAFSPRLFVQQLTYVDDVPDWDDALALLVKPTSVDAVLAELREAVKQWSTLRFHREAEVPMEGGLQL
jgi:hypothetical protein